MRPPDYLAIGHVTRDLLPNGVRSGGTVSYAALTARGLGWSAGLVTAAAADHDLSSLDGLALERFPSPDSTTYENIYGPAGRTQFLRAQAAPLPVDAIPPAWRRPRLAHLAPMAQELDPALTRAFPGAFIGLTPQGWLRHWDAAGRVWLEDWPQAEEILPQVQAVVISLEDVHGDRERAARWARWAPVLALTEGPAGCSLYSGGHWLGRVPAETQIEVDPTGAGDVFAAAFFIGLCESGDPLAAARLANRLAGLSVTRPGLAGAPTAAEAAAARQAR